MKKAKMVAIVAAMTTALVMALSASSAMAATGDTTICKTATAPCPVASQYAANTAFTGGLKSGVNSVLSTNIDTVTCTGSSVALQNNEQSGTPLTGQINSLSFSGCTDSNNQSCTVTITGTPFSGSISAGTTAGNGSLTVNSVNAKVVCGAFISCTFVAPSSGITGTVTGGNPASVKFTNAPLNNSGGVLCPSTATYSSTYVLTGTNTAAYIEKSS